MRIFDPDLSDPGVFQVPFDDDERENLWDHYIELAVEEFVRADPTHPADAARRAAEFADSMCDRRAQRFQPEEQDEAE